MAKTIKILGVHGLGDHRNSTWESDWENTIRASFPGQNNIDLKFEFLNYDKIFEKVEISTWETAKALYKLIGSAVSGVTRKRRGIVGRASDKVKWTAGYVVAWVEDDEFKKKTRKLALNTIKDSKPDIILAHSLGSLITYNAITHPDANQISIKRALKSVHYVTLGSQIGNPFVISNLTPGRIEPLNVKQWYHLYNEEDDVFTAPIRLWDADNFKQVDTFFDIEGFADHSAESYLSHALTKSDVWRPIAENTLAPRARTFGSQFKPKTRIRSAKAPDRQKHRALLVGINDYPNDSDKLEGCVNDVFLMSSVLQECGFPPESIRTCLDERATAKGISERLEWLMDDPHPDDQRVFYYSGHGASIPEYGEQNEPDRLLETLVPWDFDWSPETAITDDEIYSLYSQLPYGTRLAMIFDCCHSGGIHKDGGNKARGLNPPDDIRHRALKWDLKTQMWVAREFKRRKEKFSKDKKAMKAFFGKNGATAKLGRAALLRNQSDSNYKKLKSLNKAPIGPYLPLIIEACQEDEFSYEYRHGVTSYGAFTYSLCSILRLKKKITFEKLVANAKIQLKDLEYDQEPQILGPSNIVSAQVPWLGH